MTPETFHERIHLVIDRLGKNAPPHELFAGGVEDWHARARLAHFLAQMPEHRT
ncbi:MAG: tetratricopeptide repeat protein, partial [Selenomonas sp.]|nr:tetratricopeptide repeat protein [Selenomonas sp.]